MIMLSIKKDLRLGLMIKMMHIDRNHGIDCSGDRPDVSHRRVKKEIAR